MLDEAPNEVAERPSVHIGLLDLPVELVCKCLEWLPLSAVMRWMACSRAARDVATRDVRLWRLVDFYDSQGKDKGINRRVNVDLEKVTDECVLAILEKVPTAIRRFIRLVRLDYSAVTFRLVQKLLTSDLYGLKWLSLHGCRNVLFPSQGEFRRFLANVVNSQACSQACSQAFAQTFAQTFPHAFTCHPAAIGLLGTTIYTPMPHVPSHLTPCTLDYLTYSWAAVLELDSHRWEQAHMIASDGQSADRRGQGIVPELPPVFDLPRCTACLHHLVRIFNMDSINIRDVQPAKSAGKTVSMMDPVRTHVYQHLIPCPICHKREHLCQSYSCSIRRPICAQCGERGPCLDCQAINVQKPPSSQDLSKRRKSQPRQRFKSDDVKPLFRVIPPSSPTQIPLIPPIASLGRSTPEAAAEPERGAEIFRYHYDSTSPKINPIARFFPGESNSQFTEPSEYFCSPLCRSLGKK